MVNELLYAKKKKKNSCRKGCRKYGNIQETGWLPLCLY